MKFTLSVDFYLFGGVAYVHWKSELLETSLNSVSGIL